MGLGELDGDGLGFFEAVAIGIDNFHQQLVVGERLVTHLAMVGVITVAKTDENERHGITSQA
ncbi:hypothetical protein D3C84_1041130 [compost metagenome]